MLEFLTVVTVFWDVMPFCLVPHQRIKRPSYFIFKAEKNLYFPWRATSTNSSVTPATSYLSTRQDIPSLSNILRTSFCTSRLVWEPRAPRQCAMCRLLFAPSATESTNCP